MICINTWKRLLIFLVLVLTATGCAVGTKAADKDVNSKDGQNAAGTAPAAANKTEPGEAGQMQDKRMLVRVVSNQTEIVFELNDTTVSRSFYRQLPLTVSIDNYSNNEKVFQPPRKLNCAGATEESCPAGTIAYFAPWNNVCLFYGDAPRYSGLYVMGKAVKNAGMIRDLTGKVRVEAN